MAKVEAIGGFFPLDAQGNIINPTGRNLIPPAWYSALSACLQFYQDYFGNALQSMWIRGSLARGQAKEAWSDLDLFGLIESEVQVRWSSFSLSLSKEKKLRRLLPLGFEQVPLEMMYSTFNSSVLREMPKIGMLVKTQSLCWWGEDIRDRLPNYQPGPAMMLNYRWLESDWESLQASKIPCRISYQSFIKTLVRTAFELVMNRLGKYTTDLYWCAEAFTQYYPQKGITLKKILNLYVQPLKEKYQLTALLEEITPWMISESKRQIS
ncbi:MAG: hypothetical protein KTR30_23510 [Saprospiraceae bacterium]|nr:hypothetical protein [Saprospiraceae bacterium]